VQAIERGAWKDARAHLQASLAAGETPQALEQLGLAAWWLDDSALTFDARERAYRLYRDQGDARGAARVALWLVWDYLAFRNDTAVASGWLERARRLLAGHEATAEYGWLLLRDGEVALFRSHDPLTARDRGEKAAALGRATGDRGLEFTGLALEGLARVSAGDVAAGLRMLDEATAAATAGEVKELHTVGVVCCWEIFACERVRDYDRAAQWCERVLEFTKRWRIRVLSAVCRTQYAGVLIWGGRWSEAEEELATATRDFEQVRPPLSVQAFARLGDLRLRQGRLDEAATLFERAGSQPIARLGLAAVALERGAADEAAAEVDRFLAGISAAEQTSRAGPLELLVRAHVARGDTAGAARARDELRHIAATIGTTALAASAALADALVLRRAGDLTAAAGRFEQAAALYEEGGAPYETARARLELADTLSAMGQQAVAQREAAQARQRLEQLAGSGAPGTRRKQALTDRQVEILRLVAQGLSNPEIAERLRLSDHTVKRHVANLLTKLSLPSRAAAAAYAAKAGLL
jgi:DNA-binding NarL/FixJ family response regulator